MRQCYKLAIKVFNSRFYITLFNNVMFVRIGSVIYCYINHSISDHLMRNGEMYEKSALSLFVLH